MQRVRLSIEVEAAVYAAGKFGGTNMGFDMPKDNSAQPLVYKTIGDRKLELTFLPPLVSVWELAPVYLVIPGGGWHMENREDMLDFSKASVKALRESGFAAVSIDYRVSPEAGVTMEEIISDCFDAARYIAHVHAVLQVDPHRIAVSGHSAGGHLALMLAYAPQELFRKGSVLEDAFSVTVAAPLSPPTVLYKTEDATLGIQIDHAFAGCNTEEVKQKTSPYTYVSPKCPPTVLCAGTSDRLVYCNSSELLYQKLRENGVPCKLLLSLGGGHCFEQMHDGIVPAPSREDMQTHITEFIKRNQ